MVLSGFKIHESSPFLVSQVSYPVREVSPRLYHGTISYVSQPCEVLPSLLFKDDFMVAALAIF